MMKLRFHSFPVRFATAWKRSKRVEEFQRIWYRYSRNYTSVFGLFLLLLIVVGAAFANYLAPYPEHAGAFVDFKAAKQSPSLKHPFGTDLVGRDIFSRVLFGYRFSLLMGVVVLSIAVPVGVTIGLVAGYFQDTWVETLLMRITDVFMGVPPLLLALTITAVLPPTLTNAMLAITVMWWPYVTRIVYALSKSISTESFILAAESVGASRAHILFREILPNCAGPIFTKITLDMGWVILMGSVLSFVGLGVKPPQPGLGTMVAEGSRYLPSVWWLTVFPALAIVLVIYSFNLIGDGLAEALAAEEV